MEHQHKARGYYEDIMGFSFTHDGWSPEFSGGNPSGRRCPAEYGLVLLHVTVHLGNGDSTIGKVAFEYGLKVSMIEERKKMWLKYDKTNR